MIRQKQSEQTPAKPGAEKPQSKPQDVKDLFRQLGCSGCHVGQGTVRAPALDGLFGKPVPLQDGTVVVADDRYIRDSILMPASQVAAGYAPVMPSFAGRVSEDELIRLVAYIKSLSPEAGLQE
jgi:cytochrome c oxidase subunit 2